MNIEQNKKIWPHLTTAEIWEIVENHEVSITRLEAKVEQLKSLQKKLITAQGERDILKLENDRLREQMSWPGKCVDREHDKAFNCRLVLERIAAYENNANIARLGYQMTQIARHGLKNVDKL